MPFLSLLPAIKKTKRSKAVQHSRSSLMVSVQAEIKVAFMLKLNLKGEKKCNSAHTVLMSARSKRLSHDTQRLTNPAKSTGVLTIIVSFAN